MCEQGDVCDLEDLEAPASACGHPDMWVWTQWNLGQTGVTCGRGRRVLSTGKCV